ncbi:MAG: hypothetical protein F6K10_20365 [Moorea sp. SIO2B7]|nr:hypothetical protein [Moorena sp. SIO2B7]
MKTSFQCSFDHRRIFISPNFWSCTKMVSVQIYAGGGLAHIPFCGTLPEFFDRVKKKWSGNTLN